MFLNVNIIIVIVLYNQRLIIINSLDIHWSDINYNKLFQQTSNVVQSSKAKCIAIWNSLLYTHWELWLYYPIMSIILTKVNILLFCRLKKKIMFLKCLIIMPYFFLLGSMALKFCFTLKKKLLFFYLDFSPQISLFDLCMFSLFFLFSVAHENLKKML